MTKAALIAIVLMAACVPAWAASSSSSSSSSSASNDGAESKHSSHSSVTHYDQDDARDALRKGQVMPLTAILGIVARREPGTVLEVDLETEDGVLTYRIDVLADDGRTARVRLNARTGEILSYKHRDRCRHDDDCHHRRHH